MAYKEEQAERVRATLWEAGIDFREIKMMGGCCFMVDDKMCVGVLTDKNSREDYLMARIGPDAVPDALEKTGVRPMDFTGRSMKDYVFVSDEILIEDDALAYWVGLALTFNPLAKASKKKKGGKT